MSDRPTLTRRGLFRGVGTAAILGGCANKANDGGTKPPTSADASSPGEIGLEPSPVRFTLNGKPAEANVEPRTTLLDALRIDLDTTGAKVVCDRGACGACTVLIDGQPRNACMTLAHDVAGREVTTVEGLGEDGRLSALQQAFVEHDALQCGFCTSGMLVSCAGLLRRRASDRASLTDADVRAAIAGNICRCGTYPHVVAAVLDVAKAGGKGGVG